MQNRTALVTGSSRGIGREIALTLAKNGYNIVVNYHKNHIAARQITDEIARYSRVICVQADVGNPLDVDKLYHAATKSFGSIDTVVNNAGVAISGLFIDSTDADFDLILGTNLRGTFNVCRKFLPDMLQNQFGRVINISSILGQTGAAMESLYATSKAAIIGLTKSLSRECARMGVTVNCIAPGAIDTDMLHQLPNEVIESLKDSIAVGRIGTPQDVASAVLFLSSTQAEYTTGQVLGVNGDYIG